MKIEEERINFNDGNTTFKFINYHNEEFPEWEWDASDGTWSAEEINIALQKLEELNKNAKGK